MHFTAIAALALAVVPSAVHAATNGTIVHPTSDSKLDLASDDRSMNITWTYEGDTELWDVADVVLQGQSKNETERGAEWFQVVEGDVGLDTRSVTWNATKGVAFLDDMLLNFPDVQEWAIRYGVRYTREGSEDEDIFYSEPVALEGEPYDGPKESGGAFSAGRNCAWAGGVVALAAWTL